MRVTLEVRGGPGADRRVELRPGQVVRVGRLDKADLVIRDDAMLSSLHFVLECGEQGCRLRDLDSRFGTLLNKRRITDALLRDGDQILAGTTTFQVRVEGATPPAAPPPAHRATLQDFDVEVEAETEPGVLRSAAAPVDPIHERALTILREQPEPLFALLDAARDELIYARLTHCGEEYQSLYEGPKGEALASVGPYLVRLPKGSPLLETLVREGWGNSWGVYLTSAQPFKEVRRHLRRFLIVHLADTREVYFRYYDPRVLREYLPTCTADELSAFFGPVSCYLLEADEPTLLLKLTPSRRGLHERGVLLAEGVEVG
jgi:hypothetical protein